jgi:hypothetical protein
MFTLFRPTVVPILLVALASLAGCANPWQKSYAPTPPFAGIKFSPTQQVEVRYVEPQRMEAYRADYAKRRVHSDIAIEDLPWKDQAAEQDTLMQTLRLPVRTPEAVVIGSSEFADIGPGAGDENQLKTFAKSIGADYVVVCREFMGVVRTTESQPLDTTASQTYWFRDRRGRIVAANAYGTSTQWVPVEVDRDRWHFVAYYVRKLRPGDRVP